MSRRTKPTTSTTTTTTTTTTASTSQIMDSADPGAVSFMRIDDDHPLPGQFSDADEDEITIPSVHQSSHLISNQAVLDALDPNKAPVASPWSPANNESSSSIPSPSTVSQRKYGPRILALTDPDTEPSSPAETNTDGGGDDADEEEGFGRDMDDDFNDDDDDEDGYEEFDQDIEDDDEILDDLGDQWHEASGDFTKQFNKMRNRMMGEAGTAVNAAGSHGAKAAGESAGSRKAKQAAPAANAPGDKASREKSEAALAEKLAAKFSSRLKLDNDYEGPVSSSVHSDIRTSSRKAEGDKTTKKDKSDRATVEQVLDPRTRIILFKMLNNNTIYEVNGCISTGKEANVYHAMTESGEHRAIKIYKTSILTFKDRDRYVSGEFRFRHGYSKSNPRKMVKLWAEKEMRNLKRLMVAGIPCPEPLLLRMHVLLMTFLGDSSGWAAPRLKDAPISDPAVYRRLYLHLLKLMWRMYHKCKLVHADLSEYNLLYHNKTLYIIDVSQAVEHDHPHALEFLRKDCANVVDYFRKRVDEDDGPILCLRELFEFVVTDLPALRNNVLKYLSTKPESSAITLPDPTDLATDEDALLTEILVHLHNQSIDRAKAANRAEAQIQEAVFKSTFIPRTLTDVVDVERDLDMMKKGKTAESGADIYQKVTGVVLSKDQESSATPAKVNAAAVAAPAVKEKQKDKVVVALAPVVEDKATAGPDSEDSDGETDGSSKGGDNEDNEEEDNEEDSDDDDEDDEDGKKESKLKKDEDKEAKKARKAAAKEEKREKRKNKVPKSVKKRKQKVAAEKGKKK
ncbi:Serine/threonine-protein kinase RIO1 [Blyttiomyces sp. JEL0837]|nr:Serine/threonine-protein kinase RIO1 [Blyttiomyces sp. JEL0837]